jgi:hypothetical protein
VSLQDDIDWLVAQVRAINSWQDAVLITLREPTMIGIVRLTGDPQGVPLEGRPQWLLDHDLQGFLAFFMFTSMSDMYEERQLALENGKVFPKIGVQANRERILEQIRADPSKGTPDWYRCSSCNIIGCKLWRTDESEADNDENWAFTLFCGPCGLRRANQAAHIASDGTFIDPNSGQPTNFIGYFGDLTILVPALVFPKENGEEARICHVSQSMEGTFVYKVWLALPTYLDPVRPTRLSRLDGFGL